MSEPAFRPQTYYAVFVALVVLTILTVSAGFLDLGPWHTAAGLLFGGIKAGLVICIFMHLWYAPRMFWIALGAGLFWLGIMIVLTLSDYITRPWLSY
jgi:cytochrome c oxidase subunit 4